MTQKIFVLYHAGCADGFGAACAAYHAYGENATYIPVQYGKPLPSEVAEALDSELREHKVDILDFSYDLPTMLMLQSKSRWLTVIDHHKTAIQTIQHLDEDLCTVVFDLSHSGTSLAWRHYHEGVPDLALHIEDRDLWKFELEGTKEIHAALMSYPFSFDAWVPLFMPDALKVDELVEEGTGILRYINQNVDKSCKHAKKVMLAYTFEGGTYLNKVMLVQSNVWQSEIGNKLVLDNPDVDFAMIYFDTLQPDMRVFSLRSRPDFDASVVAKRFGGGGHAQACGFSLPVSDVGTELNFIY